MKKRLLAGLLALGILCGLTACGARDTGPTSGACGDNVWWSYGESTRTLTIGGAGAMEDYEWFYGDAPWSVYARSIKAVVMEDGVTSIGDGAFWGFSSLTGVTIPDSVTSIGHGAFSNCSSLANVTIPDSVTSVGACAFWDCSSLAGIVIPDGVTSIGKWAFSHCPNLTSVTIPDSVTSIGINAFSVCTGLTSVTIPSSVTSIGTYAFYDCTKLADVYYTGTEAQWAAISIEGGRVYNAPLLNATIHYNSLG